MNNVLIGIGVLIVAVLSALFAVPHFVDWNSYRGVIEEEASRILARDVRIGGDIELRLLPVPSFAMQKLRIADGITGSGEPLFRAERVDVKLSMIPLVRGVLEASEIELVKPEVHLVLDDAGQGNWRNVSRELGSLPYSPTEVALQAVKITDGLFVLLDRSGARERLTVDHVAGSLSAPALKGPYRFRGHFGADGKTRDLGVTTLPADASGTMQVKVALSDTATAASATFDGYLSDLNGQPQVNGELTAVLPRPAQVAPPIAPSVAKGTTTAAALTPLADLKTTVAGDSTHIDFKDLSIAFDSSGRPEILGGNARFTWDKGLDTVARLSTPWLDLDNVLGNPEGGNPLQALTEFARRINAIVPGHGTSSTVLDIEQASLGHEAVGGIRIDARSTAGLLALQELRATLPGGSRLEVQGSINGDGVGTTFDGDMTLRGTSLARLTNWATAGGVVIAPANDQAFQLRSRVIIEPSRSGLPDIVASFGDSTLEGSLDYNWQDRPRVRVTVEGARIDARAVAPAKFSLALLAGGPADVQGDPLTDATSPKPETKSEPKPDIKADPNIGTPHPPQHDVDLSVSVKTAELILPDRTLRDVVVLADRSARGVTIERLQFSGSHGVALNMAAVLPGAAVGPVAGAAAGSSGAQVRGSIAAGDAEGVQDLARLLGIPAAAHISGPLLAGLVPVRLAVTGSIPRAAEGHSERMAFTAAGQLGALDTTIKADLAAGWSTWRTQPASLDMTVLAPQQAGLAGIALNLLRGEAPDFSGKLPVVAGVPAPAAPARLGLRAIGVPADGMATVARYDSPDLTVFVDGTSRVTDTAGLQLSADVMLDARDGRGVIADIGGLRLAMTTPLDLRGQGRLTAGPGMLSLANLALTSGDSNRIAGQLTLATATAADDATTPAEPLRRLTGALSLSAIDMASLLPVASPLGGSGASAAAGAVAAASAALAAHDGGGSLWPQGTFDLAGLRGLDITLALKADAMHVARGVTVTNAALTVLGHRGLLEVRDLTGSGFGGRVAATAQLQGAQAGAALTAKVDITGTPLAQFDSTVGTTGVADISLAVSGSGGNAVGLMAGLVGTGTIRIDKTTTVHEVTPESLQAAIDTAVKAPAENVNATLRAGLSVAAARPAVALGPRSVALRILDGVARSTPIVLTTPEGRIRTQAAFDFNSFLLRGEWRVETRLLPPPPLPPAVGPLNAAPQSADPGPKPTDPGPVISTTPVALPPLVQRFAVPLAGRLVAGSALAEVHPPPETAALERELAVRKVERDLAELERLRRLDEARIAAEKARDDAIAAEKASIEKARLDQIAAEEAKAAAEKAAVEKDAAAKADWTRQTETAVPVPQPAAGPLH